MGYRLHATIPNIQNYDNHIELGKQVDYKWVEFNDKWFSPGFDGGTILSEDLQEFYEELVEINKKPGQYDLYNLDLLKEYIDHAVKHKYTMHFISY